MDSYAALLIGKSLGMTASYTVTPIDGPISGTVRPPGSKSLTNRALVVAALADGPSRLTGVLDSQDTRVMVESLNRLGIAVDPDFDTCEIRVTGCGGRPPAEKAELWLENSGTSIRFLTALCALGHGEFVLDGNSRMRERPIRDLVDALKLLDVDVTCQPETGAPPVTVRADGLQGGQTTLNGSISSQYLSALLMTAPCAGGPLTIDIDGELVSRPYIDMTLGVMARFAVTADWNGKRRYKVEPQTYRATDYDIEPDASAASYFFALAAITGGKVTVEGLSYNALQGDVHFVDALEEMGCRVDHGADSLTVTGGELRGIDIDMNAISDTAQTLAAVAPFADGPTTIRNIGHVRHKETDRIAAVATELRRLGLSVDEEETALTIHPGPMHAAAIETYDDHRMAMSFSLIGLRVSGVEILDPGCTAKTYPRYWEDLERICGVGS